MMLTRGMDVRMVLSWNCSAQTHVQTEGSLRSQDQVKKVTRSSRRGCLGYATLHHALHCIRVSAVARPSTILSIRSCETILLPHRHRECNKSRSWRRCGVETAILKGSFSLIGPLASSWSDSSNIGRWWGRADSSLLLRRIQEKAFVVDESFP